MVVAAVVGMSLHAGAAHGSAPPLRSAQCAPGPPGTFFATTRLGVIDLYLFGARGAHVRFFECIGSRAVELGRRTAPPDDEFTRMAAATTWRCGRLVRRFAATATRPDGSVVRGFHAIRTRSCAQRFDLDVPRRLEPGSLARVRISDRWDVGEVRFSLCIARPGQRAGCRPVVLRRGTRLALRTFRVTARGRWGVEVRARGPEVHVVRLDLLFTPNGYREVIRYRGRDVRVREPDGIHLTIAGAEIAAREVVKAIHATGG